MHQGAQCVSEHQSLTEAARMMRDLGVGSLPICSDQDRLIGIITDRDIVIRCIAEGHDPSQVTAANLAQGRLLCVDANSDLDSVLHLMEQHRIRRLPVLSNDRLVGMISEADLARNLPEDQLAHFVESVYA